jgi:molecular chaperone GrpE
MSELNEEGKGFRIHVRSEDGPEEGGGASREHPAASVEPPVRGAGPAAPDGSDEDPVIVSVDDEVAVQPDEAEPTVGRARYLELGRENLRLGEQVKKLQADLYQANLREKAAEAKSQEQREAVARAQAEFQNYRRRLEREREEAAKYASSDLIRDLLPVLDNFERALKSASQGAAAEDFNKGIALIYKQLQDVLAGYELKTMDVLGLAFDPNVHEAVTRAHHPTIPADQVIAEHQKGYFYKDRLLRPALVGVSAGTPEGEDAPQGPTSTATETDEEMLKDPYGDGTGTEGETQAE